MKYISVREYAKRQGISYSTAYRKIESGELKAKRIERLVWRVPIDETEVAKVKSK